MRVSTHPKELTKDAVEKWLEDFKKKLKRKTCRDDLDRLILSVERSDFEKKYIADWEEVIFENGKGKVSGGQWKKEEEWAITSFQKMIIGKNPHLERKIQRSELKEEIEGEYVKDGDITNIPKIQWVSQKKAHKIKMIIPKVLFIDEEFNEDSLEVLDVYCEPYYLQLKEGEEIQFIRFGYCRKDSQNQAIFTHK